MGNHSSLTRAKLEEYQDCTFFTKTEIIHIHNRFKSMNPDFNDGSTKKLSKKQLLDMPELKNNGFVERIIEVFGDSAGNMCFEDFLDCMSVFSRRASRDVKATYAFRLYDFDSDNYLNEQDIIETIKVITGDTMTPSEMTTLAHEILEESDMDSDGRLSYVEFEHVINRSQDFMVHFHIRI